MSHNIAWCRIVSYYVVLCRIMSYFVVFCRILSYYVAVHSEGTYNVTLQPYRKILQELALSDEDLILKGEKIVLPERLHKLALDKAHQGGHPGMTGLKRRLRSHFWFPQMDSKIESMVASCKQKLHKSCKSCESCTKGATEWYCPIQQLQLLLWAI